MFGLDNCKLPFYFACYADLVPGKKRVESVHKTEKIMEKIVAKKEIVEKPCYYDDVPKLDLKIPGLEPSMILKLQELVVKYSLQDGRYAPKMAPPSWRYNLIDILSKLTKKICPTYQVSHEFLNIMWNMIHIYWHQIKPDEINIKIDEDFWIRKISELQNCSLEIVNGGFYMEGRGDFAMSVEGMEILVREEIVDLDMDLDMVMDSFWFMFQTSVGACYPFQIHNQTNWIVEYFTKFKVDVLFPLMFRWSLPNDVTDEYGLFIGDVDVKRAVYNLRVCSTATFALNSISDRQLARPMGFGGGMENEFAHLEMGA
ncbi:uncharacterized protein LOC110844927 [Folsomia candida]|nr:uncharacterized protein LOC110844927 [Folsomia candida]